MTYPSAAFSHLSGVADKLCMIRSLHTEFINHDPAITFCQNGKPTAWPAQHWGLGQLRTWE